MVDRILDTGYDLQNQGYIFRGLASHFTGTPTERTWLIAPTGSTGFGLSSPVPPGSIGICMYNGSSWSAEVLNTLTLDTAPATGSGNGITSGAVKTLAESITNAIGQLEQSVSDRFTSLELEDTTGSLQAEVLSITLKYIFEGEEETLTSLSILAATAEKAGLMSAADKQKLDAFVTNIRSLRIQDTTAQADQGTEITNTMRWTIEGVTEAITAFTLYAATTSKAGLMSAADKTALDTLPSLINAGYLYAGIATPATVPSSTDAKIFYIAIEGGTYTNFGNLNVTQGINIIYKSGNAWSVAQVVGIDNEPTAGSDNLVKSDSICHKIGNVNDIYYPIPDDGDGNGFYRLEDGELIVYPNNDFRVYHLANAGSLSNKLIRLRAGDTRANHYTYFCFVGLGGTYAQIYCSDMVVDHYANYDAVLLPDNVTDLYISWAKTSDGISLVPMIGYEPLDSVTRDIQGSLESTDITSDDYLTLRGIDFSADGANPAMGKFIKHLSFIIPSAAKNHEIYLRFLGVLNDEFFFGLFDKTENKLIGNARKAGYETIPSTGIEEFDFVGLLSSSAASYNITNVKLIVDWDYYPGFYNDGRYLYKILTTNDSITNVLINKTNALMACTFDLSKQDGKGYYNNNGQIIESGTWAYKRIDMTKYAGKVLRMRAGDFTNDLTFNQYCFFMEEDDTVIPVANVTLMTYSDYSLIRVPENTTTLLMSWGSSTQVEYKPMLKYEPNDDAIYTSFGTKGYLCNDARYNACILGIEIDIPAAKRNNALFMYLFGVNDGNKRFYFGIYDKTENKRLAYVIDTKIHNVLPTSGVEVFDFSTFSGNETSYQLARLRVAIDWKNYSSDMWVEPVGQSDGISKLIRLNYVSGSPFFYLYDQTQKLSNIDIKDNLPVFPPHLFLLSDRKVPLYKNSLMTKYDASISDIDINIKSDATAVNGRKVYEVGEPTYFDTNDFGSDATMFIQRSKELGKLIFRDMKIFHKDTSALSGKTFKLMALGDSLTQGTFSGGTAKDGWRTTPPCMVAQGLMGYGVSTQFIGSMVRTYYNEAGQPVTLRYEGRGGWRYRTYVGLESMYAGVNQYPASSQTKHEYVEGVDGSINEIKQQNPFLYPATAQDLTENPEWCFHFVDGNTVYNKSYAEDSTLGDYVIFDPVRYFTMRQIDIPDVLTIALGTNEWYLNEYGGFDNAKATSCAAFMVKQFRKVSSAMKIVVIPMNNFPTSREYDWENYCMPLCSNIIEMCNNMIAAGDDNLYVCPIYAQGSRKLGYNGTVGTSSNITDINDVKEIEIDNNVHVLYENDDSNYDYKDALVACVANLIE